MVGRKIAVNQMLHEISLASTPVNHQVLGQERRDHHAGAIVRPSTVLQLSHGSVHNGEPSLTVAPGLEVIVIVFPLDIGGFDFEALVHPARFVSLDGPNKRDPQRTTEQKGGIQCTQ